MGKESYSTSRFPFSRTNKMRPTIQTSRGPQPINASYGVDMSHRLFYTTSMRVTSSEVRDKNIMFVDFHDKTRAGKHSDVVAHFGDKTNPVIARGRFRGKEATELSWENGRATRVCRGHHTGAQDSYTVQMTPLRHQATDPSQNLFWRTSWDYNADPKGYGNLELVDSAGKAYAALVTVAHKSWSKVGTMHVLTDLSPDMLEVAMLTMVAVVKMIEKQGSNSKDSGSAWGEASGEAAGEAAASSIIGAIFSG